MESRKERLTEAAGEGDERLVKGESQGGETKRTGSERRVRSSNEGGGLEG